MPNRTPTNLYDQFTAKERVTLTLRAMLRDDEAEEQRLRDSCPVYHYSMTDLRYMDRLVTAIGMAGMLYTPIAEALGKLRVVRGLAGAVPQLSGRLWLLATFGFNLGEGHGWEQASREAGLEVPEAEGEEEREEESEEEADGEVKDQDDLDEAEELPEAGDENGSTPDVCKELERLFHEGMKPVTGMAERVGREVSGFLLQLARSFAAEAATHLEVIGRWSRADLGIEPMDLLKAVRLPTEELEQAMRDFPHPELDMEVVKGLSTAARRAWAKRYGALNEDDP